MAATPCDRAISAQYAERDCACAPVPLLVDLPTLWKGWQSNTGFRPKNTAPAFAGVVVWLVTPRGLEPLTN